jgi:hypothetical protein
MRSAWFVLSLLSLTLASGALAQSGSAIGKGGAGSSATTGIATGPMSDSEIQKLGAQYLTDCIQDWDRGTHMSKQDWTRTCRRVVQRRIDYLRQQEKQ